MSKNLAQKISGEMKRYEEFYQVILEEGERVKKIITALKIYKGRLEGKGFKEIGKEIGVSKQRAHQILEQYFQGLLDGKKKITTKKSAPVAQKIRRVKTRF